jgi:lysophospholipase L1-like esterase/predicted small lipoprotein YifL
MKRTIFAPVLAALTAVSLTACGNSGSNMPVSNPFPTTNTAPTTTGTAVLKTIVGVGDSLTAGEESDGLVGQTPPANNPLYPPNPGSLNTTSANPLIMPGQPFGFWADLYNQVNGANAANNVLPLIKSPGIGTYLVLNGNGTSLISPQSSCGGLNASAFTASGALSTRVNPNVTPLDVAVPGQLVHEALYQTAPQGTCQSVSVAPGSLFQAETTNFYPILANFPGLTQVAAARALKPTLTTVWLGHNDLLKYALSNGAFGPTPASSIQADLTTIVQTLQQAGSQVAIGNLFDVLTAPLFVGLPNVPVTPTSPTDPIWQDLQILSNGAITPSAGAAALINNVLAQNNLTAGSYITFTALPAIIAYIQSAGAGTVPTGLVAANQALPASFAAQVQSTNNAYNTAISAVAQSTGAVLVDVHSMFAQVAAGTYAPALIAPANFTTTFPSQVGICCYLVPFGGLTSYDMLHPSYTGYALIANVWIAAINAKFGTSIAPVNVAAINQADPFAPNSPVYGAAHMRNGAP